MPSPPTLPAAVLLHTAACGGVLTSGDARRLGVTGRVHGWVGAQLLVRVGRGVYLVRAAYQALSIDERYAVRCLAVARSWPPGVALSHTSAACVLGLPLLTSPDGRVHGTLTGATGQHRRTAGYTIHRPAAGASTRSVAGLEVLEPAHTVLGVAAICGLGDAVVTGDAALQRGLVTHDRLAHVQAACRHHPAAAVFGAAVEAMDERCESPGESRTRLLLTALGYSVRSQVEIREPDGALVGRVDFVLAGHRVVVEFDGAVKYASADPGVLVQEKRREDRLRRLGYVVVRLMWAQLDHPGRVRDLVADACRLAATR